MERGMDLATMYTPLCIQFKNNLMLWLVSESVLVTAACWHHHNFRKMSVSSYYCTFLASPGLSLISCVSLFLFSAPSLPVPTYPANIHGEYLGAWEELDCSQVMPTRVTMAAGWQVAVGIAIGQATPGCGEQLKSCCYQLSVVLRLRYGCQNNNKNWNVCFFLVFSKQQMGQMITR